MSSALMASSSSTLSWLSKTILTTTEGFECSSFSMISLLHIFLLVYFLIEVCFALLFHFYLVPRANQRTSPQPYRDYGNERDIMLIRVIERIKKTFTGKQDFQKAVVSFLHEWCEPIREEKPLKAAKVNEEIDILRLLKTKGSTAALSSPPSRSLPLSRESMTTVTASDGDEDSSLSSSSDVNVAMEKQVIGGNRVMGQQSRSSPLPSDDNELYIVPDIKRDEVDEFFAWALFEKEPSQLLDWEHDLMAECYQLAQEKYGIGIAPGNGHRYKPRRLSLEDVNSLWRPLAIYIFFWTLTIVGAVILRIAGFQRIVSLQTGLTGWYRPPAATTNGQSLLPLLFFHGIAPAGLFFYIPKILFRLANDDRAVLLFDNTNISCALGFGALREAETVQGVLELVDRYLPDSSITGLSLCGHSFGSCPLTWLLHAPAMRHRIKQFVLLDPVTILLSEPDVMANFLYSTGCSTIRLMAGSELFTEYYLRRHFAWYNSELWLEDIPESVQVLIALSEKDEIVNVSKVKRHIDLFLSGGDNGSKSSPSRVKVLFWKEATHANCVTSPSRWTEIKQAMLEQELAIAKKSS